MNKLVKSVLIVAAVCVMAAPAMGDFGGGAFRWYQGANYVQLYAPAQVKLNGITGSVSGGAFQVDVTNGSLPFWGSGNNVATTFCVENGIYFTPNQWYWASVDKVAYSGNSGIQGDPISDVTEWIFDKWQAGNPDGWSQAAISAAIWWAENETGGSKNTVAQAALADLGYSPGTTWDQLAAAEHTLALNLWSGFYQDEGGVWHATDVQSQLIPVPGAVLLGLFGFSLIGWIKRRFA